MSATVRAAIAEAAARFAFSATPRLDAELLMAHAMGCTREAMLLARLDAPVPTGFAALADRRASQVPVAYLTGARAFWTIELAVGPGALVPRADSETLIEAAVDHFGARAPATILDLGTGPGTLLLAALDQWPAARGMGLDRSAEALDFARRNVAALRMEGRGHLVRGDWGAAIGARFDLVLANPPYVGTAEMLPAEVRAHEPAAALFAGADGLDDYRRLAPAMRTLLATGGVAVVEIGATQAEAAGALFAAHGLSVGVRRDLGGRDRALVLT